MTKSEIEHLIKTGTPGATCITQMTVTDGLVEWWCPTLNDMPIGSGKLERFETYDQAEARAREIQQSAKAA
jgi:hypothetical protein